MDLHNALKVKATSSDGKGPAAVLNLRSKVVSVDVDAPSLTLEDGSVHTADLIIGADGVHSKLRAAIATDCPLPSPSGSSAFRFLIPSDLIRSDPRTAHFVEKTGELRLLYGTDRRIVIYPCRNNTLINFVAMYPDEETEAEGEDWDQAASKETMLSCFSSYPDDVQILLSKASAETIKLWKLLDHEELGRDNWIRGKACLLGDAAHAFLPHQGQGGAQAIEDSAALGALFPLGTPASEVPRRLQLYVQARYDRATLVQDFTRQAAFKTSRGKHGGKVLDPMQFAAINFTHDAYDNAHGILLRELASKTATTRCMPFSFGLIPGLTQDGKGRARNIGKLSYKTSYITFKTHKSYLDSLLPSDELSIDMAGSWATATMSVTRLEEVNWLGGRTYSFFGMYIHNVTVGNIVPTDAPTTNCEAAIDNNIKGDFVAVLFQNQPDSIIASREELGVPTLFATLDEKSSWPNFSLSAGWEGTEFCSLTLEDLVEAPALEPIVQTPTLHWTVPTSSNGSNYNKREIVSLQPTFPILGAQKEWKAGSAKLKFTELEGKELERAFPTLGNVIKGLRDVNVVEVLKSGIITSK
jgi:2-polyprenyl-6-methoxyphenol hydroxylase-like FAD-dependent oxidoreductase